MQKPFSIESTAVDGVGVVVILHGIRAKNVQNVIDAHCLSLKVNFTIGKSTEKLTSEVAGIVSVICCIQKHVALRIEREREREKENGGKKWGRGTISH